MTKSKEAFLAFTRCRERLGRNGQRGAGCTRWLVWLVALGKEQRERKKRDEQACSAYRVRRKTSRKSSLRLRFYCCASVETKDRDEDRDSVQGFVGDMQDEVLPKK